MKDNTQKKDKLICYECNSYIRVPEDFVGNVYTLLEIHYFSEHGIDLKTVNWNKPRRVIDVLDDEIARLRGEGKPQREL